MVNDKTKISIAVIGHLPSDFNKLKIANYKSKIFEIEKPIQSFTLDVDSDGEDWEFTDSNINKSLPNAFSGDILLVIVRVPLELNWYTRRLQGNRIVFTFHEIKEILNSKNIPLENVIKRILYSYTLLYKRFGNKIPMADEHTNFAHDETRGCLFDMNGNKYDIVESCVKPIICEQCVANLKKERISDEIINVVQKEIQKIKKPLYYQISDYIKRHPLITMLVTAISAIILGGIGSYIANIIYAL